MPQENRNFTVILEREDAGGYSVYCPALPGCVSQGDDWAEAIENIKEAIALVLAALERMPRPSKEIPWNLKPWKQHLLGRKPRT